MAGNFNTLIMLRVKELETTEMLTNQLDTCEASALMEVSGVNDSSDPFSDVDFSSSNEDRISTTEVPLVSPATIMALPKGQAFVLLALIGIIDGLVQGDIRRWSGGRESAFIYHWAKKFVMPSLTLPWMIYLAMPVNIHPNLIVLPFALLFAGAVTVMVSTFKKYL